MKKLIFAAAAVAGMGAFALESANVVGYGEVEAAAGSSMKTPIFEKVADEGYDLSAIEVVGGEGIGDVCAQTISAEGDWDGEYYYLTEDGAGVATGWYKDATGEEAVEPGEVILPRGGAFFLNSDYNDLTLKVAGQVVKGDFVINFAVGCGQVGNGLPVAADLTTVTVDGGEGIGDVCAQTISAEGEWDGEYYYLTEDGAGVDTGWYKDATGEEPVIEGDVVLDPGTSVFLNSDYNDLTLTIPAVIE